MTFTSGSRASQANPAEDLYGLISTQLTAHGNWTFVEDYTVSTTKWSVWRCNAAGSSLEIDYFVMFSRSTAAGANLLYVAVAETYTVSTHSYGHPAPQGTSSTSTPAADGSYGGTTVYALSSSLGTISTLFTHSVTPGATYDYWIVVTNDGLTVTVKVGTTVYNFTLGTLDSLVPNPSVNDPVPLGIGSSVSAGNTTTACQAMMTRHPLVTTAHARLWGITPVNGTGTQWPPAMVGSVGVAGGDRFYSDQPVGVKVLARTWAYENGSSALTAGVNRGLWRHILMFNTSSVTVGDTVTVGGETYVCINNPSGTVGIFYNTSAA